MVYYLKQYYYLSDLSNEIESENDKQVVIRYLKLYKDLLDISNFIDSMEDNFNKRAPYSEYINKYMKLLDMIDSKEARKFQDLISRIDGVLVDNLYWEVNVNPVLKVLSSTIEGVLDYTSIAIEKKIRYLIGGNNEQL